ncbi:multidrug effflux MFS transporter [Thiotrichales bacterium 19S3-7]|nr:multidrug effflux MFS transporter [Thiotrichales bacterium 19S3-7]MCF6802873.1 multidrug effflux MFS transporter [Thiotrichales bacterium 19S3-11]
MFKKNNLLITVIILAIFPLPQIAIDLYLPSLPVMAKLFHTPYSYLQLSLTSYILTMGLSQLIYGPLSDFYGRKPILLIGMLLFMLGTLLCLLSNSIRIFLIARSIQGFGMGCGFSVASAMIADQFHGKKLLKISALSSIIYSLSPVFAPVIGGYLQYYVNWNSNFVFMLVYALSLNLVIIYYLPETNTLSKTRPSPSIKKVLAIYYQMIKHYRFLSYTAAMTLAFGITVTFNIIGPYLMQQLLHVSVIDYGKLLLILGLSYLVGTFLNHKLINYINVPALISFGLCLMLIASLLLIVLSAYAFVSVVVLTLLTSIIIFATGFIFPNCFAKALEIFPDNAGTSGAFIGSVGLIGNGVLSGMIAHLSVSGCGVLGYLFLIESLLIMLFMALSALGAKVCANRLLVNR